MFAVAYKTFCWEGGINALVLAIYGHTPLPECVNIKFQNNFQCLIIGIIFLNIFGRGASSGACAWRISGLLYVLQH